MYKIERCIGGTWATVELEESMEAAHARARYRAMLGQVVRVARVGQ